MASSTGLNPHAKEFVPAPSSTARQGPHISFQSPAVLAVFHASLEHIAQSPHADSLFSHLGQSVTLLRQPPSQRKWSPPLPPIKELAPSHSNDTSIQTIYLEAPEPSIKELSAPQAPSILAPMPIRKNSISKDKEILQEIRVSIQGLQKKNSSLPELERLEKLEDLSMALEMLISKFEPPMTFKEASRFYGKDALGFITTMESIHPATLRAHQELMKEAKELKAKIDQST